MPTPPKFGTPAGDSLWHDGKGGTLNRKQYEEECGKLDKALREYQRSQGKMPKETPDK
jgi:hypothetical protein